MEQYIRKSDLIVEIEKRRDAALMRQCNLEAIGQETVLNEMVAHELNRVIALLDELEIKEVDLDKEIKEYIDDEWCDEWSGDVGNWIRCCRGTSSMIVEDVKDIARHFFELGLKAQKGE